MDVKEAVSTARAQVGELFGDQIFSQPVLEEFEFDSKDRVWSVTIGFLRVPEASAVGPVGEGALSRALGVGLSVPRRAYKVVKIDDGDGHVISVKDREFG